MRRLTPPADLDEAADMLHRAQRGPTWDPLVWLADAAFVTNDLVALRYYQTPQGVRTATYRMGQLATWGLVARRQLDRRRVAWHLTEQGARLVADHLQRSPKAVGTAGTEARVAKAFVLHRLDVTRFEVALRLHAQANGGEVVSFTREPTMETEAGELRPDAAVIYRQGGRTWNYALEIDRNTERPVRFVATKVPRYEGLVRARWQLHWDELPTCLVVATQGGQERAVRLKAEIDSLPFSGAEYRLFKLVAADDLYQIPDARGGLLPQVMTAFNRDVCLAARKAHGERRAVFG